MILRFHSLKIQLVLGRSRIRRPGLRNEDSSAPGHMLGQHLILNLRVV